MFSISVGRPRLETFLKFAKVELTPPSLSDGPAIAKSINQIRNSAVTGKWKQLTVKVHRLMAQRIGYTIGNYIMINCRVNAIFMRLYLYLEHVSNNRNPIFEYT